MVGLYPQELSGNQKSEPFTPTKGLKAVQNGGLWLVNISRPKNIISQELVQVINLKSLTISFTPSSLCVPEKNLHEAM